MMSLKPLSGHALVELREKYEHVATTDQKYETKTSGICISTEGYIEKRINGDPDIINKLVFWEEYKEGAVIVRDGKKYAFIKIEDLTGFEDVETE